jgi:hypothetical protein
MPHRQQYASELAPIPVRYAVTGAERLLTGRDRPLEARLRPGKIVMALKQTGEVA